MVGQTNYFTSTYERNSSHDATSRCNRFCPRDTSHEIKSIWFHAACRGDNFLSPRQGLDLWHTMKFDPATCPCNMSLRLVAPPWPNLKMPVRSYIISFYAYMLRCRCKLLYIVLASWPIMKDKLEKKPQTFLYMKIVFHTFLLRKSCHSYNKLGLGQTSLFSCAEPNANELKQRLFFIGSRALTLTYYQSICWLRMAERQSLQIFLKYIEVPKI